MHGWDDSCVTEDGSRRCKTLTGIYVQNEPAASRKYAVNVNGHFPETPADISVTESCAGRVQTSPREADRSPRYKKGKVLLMRKVKDVNSVLITEQFIY